MSDKEHKTITLTDHVPVRIRVADWPVRAKAAGDSYRGNDYARHQQALGQGEVDEYHLIVRQHADGRTLVYGILDAATAWTQTEDHRGGRLLASVTDADLPQHIRSVGEECELPDRIIRDCIADLPAEEV
jgi:hypothetical protein